MIKLFQVSIICILAILALPSGASAQSCAAGPATVQILGSGGPALNRERASASYLLWVDGQARMLVDMGGGAYLLCSVRRQAERSRVGWHQPLASRSRL